MNYIVLDLEFNQSYDFPYGDKTLTDPKCPFEIIQIGAVKLDDNLLELDKKRFMVKPQIYTRMHPFVEKITGLSIGDFENERFFDEVYKEFTSFIGGGKNVLCAWGTNDIKALYSNILYYNLNNKLLTRKYVNVQQLASEHLKRPSNNSIGLKSAVESMDIVLGIDFHDALNDAIYTAEIFKIVKKANLQISTFNLSQLKQKTMAKVTALNSQLLFNFVEKELKRKISDREKEAVIKIYSAGQQHRFDIMVI